MKGDLCLVAARARARIAWRRSHLVASDASHGAELPFGKGFALSSGQLLRE
jgi:hypothetical protein